MILLHVYNNIGKGVKTVRILSVPSWLIKLLKGLAFFLFVRATYLTLRKRSFNTRSKVVLILAFFFYWLYKKGRERIKRNISLIHPDLNEKQINRGAWRLAKTIARSWAAIIGNEFTSLEEIIKKIDVENAETLLDYYRRKEKIVAVVGHVGPVDEMVGVIPLLDLKVYFPAEAVKPRWFFNFMMRLRLRFGDIIFDPIEKRGETLLSAARHLSDGRIVALVFDITRRDDSGVVCKIGGAKAKFSIGAAKLALEQSATIIPIFPSWNEIDNKSLIVVGEPFKLVKTGDMRYDVEFNTRRLIEEVYAPHILKNWNQWLRLLWDELEPAET